MVFDNPWYYITALGSPKGWIMATALLTLAYLVIKDDISRNRKVLIRNFLVLLIPSLAISLSIIQGVKTTFPTERICTPCSAGVENCNPYCPEDSSFPSGHTAAAFAAYGSVFFSLRSRKFLPVFIIPVLVAFSRLALGVHTPADVTAGGLVGFLASFSVYRFLSGKGLV